MSDVEKDFFAQNYLKFKNLQKKNVYQNKLILVIIEALVKILIFDKMAPSPKQKSSFVPNFTLQKDLKNLNYYQNLYAFDYYLTNIHIPTYMVRRAWENVKPFRRNFALQL